jgi:hypothetical protein
MMRSIATDLGIYFCECLRRIFIPDLIWIEGHHKRRQGGGHPRVQSTWFEKSGHSLWYVGPDSWIPTLDIIESIQFYTTYYNPDHPYINERSIGPLDVRFKIIIGGLYGWQAEVPEIYMQPKF